MPNRLFSRNTSRRVALESMALEHVARLAVLQAENYDDLRRVNPMPAQQTTAEDFQRRLEQVVLTPRTDRLAFVILVDGDVCGDMSLNHVIRYPLECANVGIFVDRSLRGQGIGTEAVSQICDHAFGTLGLHRLEAGIQPFNTASIRAFEKNGFTRIGISEQMLFVDREWRDHILFQKVSPEDAGSHK